MYLTRRLKFCNSHFKKISAFKVVIDEDDCSSSWYSSLYSSKKLQIPGAMQLLSHCNARASLTASIT